MENKNKGAGPKKTEKKILVVGAASDLKKEETKKVPLKPKKESVKKVLSLEDKILKVKQMSELVLKRKKLNDAILKLDGFELSDDNLNTVLTISDGARYEEKKFTTTNSIIIDNVAELLKTKVFAQIDKVEKEIEALV